VRYGYGRAALDASAERRIAPRKFCHAIASTPSARARAARSRECRPGIVSTAAPRVRALNYYPAAADENRRRFCARASASTPRRVALPNCRRKSRRRRHGPYSRCGTRSSSSGVAAAVMIAPGRVDGMNRH